MDEPCNFGKERSVTVDNKEHSLLQFLESNTIYDLKELARASKTSGCSKMRKAELVNTLYESLQDAKYVKAVLCCLNQEEWKLFKKASGQKQVAMNEISDDALFAQSMGLMQVFFTDGQQIIVVPEEIRTIYTAMIHDGSAAIPETLSLLNSYAQAAVNLYGIIPYSELISLYNQQNTKMVTEDEYLPVLIENSRIRSDYCFFKQYIVRWDFEDDGFKNVAVLKNAIQGKSRYIPPKEEFLRYTDPFYYERTPQVKCLVSYLTKSVTHDEIDALDIVDEIVFICMCEKRMSDIFEVFTKRKIMFRDTKQVNALLPLIQNVWNHTRIWSNNGHTPDEIFNSNKRPSLKIVQGGTQKPGRNDSCPCGSGKKYKNCCGKGD